MLTLQVPKCRCNKVCTHHTIIGERCIIYKCPITAKILADIKLKPSGIELVWEDNPVESCGFYEKVRMKPDYMKKWEKFGSYALSLLEVPPPPASTIPKMDEATYFKHKLQVMCDDVEKRGTFNIMSWEKISKFDYYAINHLLIEPWQQSGPKKETWEQYVTRFKSTPWIDKNYKIREMKYEDYLRRKEGRRRYIEKTCEILDIFPNLKKKIKKDMKKELKQREKDTFASGYNREKDTFMSHYNIQHYGFYKFDKEQNRIKNASFAEERQELSAQDLDISLTEDIINDSDANFTIDNDSSENEENDSEDEDSLEDSSPSHHEDEEEDYGEEDYGEENEDGYEW